MDNRRLLYLVQHTNKQMFKIGIASGDSRFNDLNRDYSIDWKSSIYFEGENDDITKMERILHRGFYKNRLEQQNGTGGTEWFNSECIENVVDAIVQQTPLFDFQINLQPFEIDISKENSIIKSVDVMSKSWNERKQEILNKYPSSIIEKWLKLEISSCPNSDIEMNKLIPEFMTFNKPSELCQVMYFEDREKGVYANFSAIEIDMVNLILYKSREQIIKSKEEFDPDKIFIIELPLNEIATMLKKYKNTSFEPLIKGLRNIRSKEVVINALGKNKDINITYTSIIHKVNLSKHRDKRMKCVRVQVDTELIALVLDIKKMFSKMFLEIQYSFSLKYSKLLYELLKDYIGIHKITINYELLLGLLNVKNTNRYLKYSYFNGEILKPTLKEINEKSDIIIDYEPVKEKLEGQRKQVTKIKFKMKKQSESRLQELGLIEESITDHKFYNKSKSKLTKLMKTGYKVIDEEMWITTDINKNEDRYDSEVRIDRWMKETTVDDRNELFTVLASTLVDCDDPVVSIEDYAVRGVFTKDTFTKNPQETIELLNKTILSISETSN